jgi:hypothetical protein
MSDDPVSDPLDAVWVVSYDHLGESGITIEGIFATEQAAGDYVTGSVFKTLGFKIERWDVTR